MEHNIYRELYETYAAAVAYIAVERKDGNESIGSAFHVGEGVFITARHVIEGNRILKMSTTESAIKTTGINEFSRTVELMYFPGDLHIIKGPFYHPDINIDVAVIVVEEKNIPVIPLGDHLDDWLGTDLVLQDVIVMGYPPIPFSANPILIATKAEVNAIVDKYTGGHPHFILSSLARGGFSGGVALTTYGCALGVITEALVSNDLPSELGYLAVLSVEPIFVCLGHHKIMPIGIRNQWLIEGEELTIWEE